jgi:phosphoglucomutase
VKRPSRQIESEPPRRIERAHAADRPIRLGTGGWRGAFGEEVTYPRLRILIRSIADWLHERDDGKRVLIGWDRRFASESMAEMSASILFEAGLEPVLAKGPVPTTALTHALAQGGHAAGLAITASHNPPVDHGLKLFAKTGSAIGPSDASRIEAIARLRRQDDRPSHFEVASERVDIVAAYCETVGRLLDRDAIARAGIHVVYDAMHGCGAGVLDRILESAGASVTRLRSSVDPTFGGVGPDPLPERLQHLAREMRGPRPASLGLATDGDADRIGVMDGQGRSLSEAQVVALLVDRLARRGLIARGLAISVATGSLVDRVARSHGLHVERHPIGFKHLSAAIDAGRADVAGDESGGFALACSSPDKDGVLAGCLLADLVAVSGEGLDVHVARLEERFGTSACGRVALARSSAVDLAHQDLVSDPPSSIDGARVRSVDFDGGLRFEFEDSGFLMIRKSETESMLRIYGEAATQIDLERRLDAGRGLLDVAPAKAPIG